MGGSLQGSPRPRYDILIGVVIIVLWLGVAAYMESVMVNRVPNTAIPGMVWGAPTLVGFVAFAFMLTRVANALTERNVKLAEAERATARTAAELEAVLENIADPMMVKNRQGCLVRANRAFAELVGVNAVGFDYEQLHGPDGVMPVYREDGSPLTKANLFSTRALSGETVQGETLLVKRGKQDEFFLASSAPVWDPHTRQISGTVTILKDISELKRLERLKDEFISTTSHELRTPLAVIRGYAELQLLAQKRSGAKSSLEPDTAVRIVSEVDRMVGLIDQMLQIARLDSGTVRLSQHEVDLANVVRDEVSALGVTTTPGRLDLEINAAAKNGTALCRIDVNAFRQVLGNLVSNALKYSPEASPITIRVALAHSEAVVSVADRGVGIPHDELPLIFEKFYRSTNVSATATGLGLGLYITARLVELQGGRIWVESKIGQGSTFHVALPVLTTRARAAQTTKHQRAKA